MTFSEWTESLGKAIDLIEKDRENECLRIVSDTMALLKRRIINDRVDDAGASFGQYSDAVVPFWFYKSKESRGDAAARADELYKRQGYWASYQDWREVNNLTGDDINFSFTGEMWKSMVPVVVRDEGGDLIIGIIADDEGSDEKIGYHIRRFPNLLDLNELEEKLLTESNQRRIENIFKKVGII